MTQPIHETGVWKIHYPQALKNAVINTADSWSDFCTLPNEVQDLFASNNMFNGSGFERKTGSGEESSHFSHDRKLNFDLTARDIAPLKAKLEAIDDRQKRQIAEKFLGSLSLLAQKAPQAINEFGKIIERDFGVGNFHEVSKDSAPDAFFRCLYYPPTHNSEEIIGEPHIDNSGFTLHLYESTNGCEALSKNKRSWDPMPVANGEALAFPGMQTQLYTEGKVDGLCHRILSNEKSQEFGRVAIICFVALRNVPAYDRTHHGRLQEKVPGFNYGMEPEAFAQLFSS